ncbi:MAG: hypothetical protein ACSW8C_02125 [bacterium]
MEQLKALIEHQSQEHDAEAHYLISQLEIADEHAQEAIKAFTEYAVSKELTVTKLVVYNDGISGKIDRSTEEYQTYEAEHDGVLTKSDPDATEYTYASKLADSYGSLEDLRALTTAKFTVTRTITTTCYKDKTKEDLADKYDDLAYREMVTEENSSSSTTSAIALFDELPLLDKLKYITVYYKKIEPQEQTNPVSRYVFPEDAKIGFPCVQPKASTSPTDDTNEIGQLEMFYIGYLVDRDGPVNALASFMEVKTVAIKAQIVLLSYRVKALQYYTNLLNKGLEKLNESQAEDKDKLQPIPVVSYNILRYFGANITRSLQYLKDADGNFLEDGDGKALTNPYLVIQYQGDKPGTDGGYDDPDTPYHLTKNNFYALVEATEEGISSFLNWNDVPWVWFDECFKNNDFQYEIGWKEGRKVGNPKLGNRVICNTVTWSKKDLTDALNALNPPLTINNIPTETTTVRSIDIAQGEIQCSEGDGLAINDKKITVNGITIETSECSHDATTNIIRFKNGKIKEVPNGRSISYPGSNERTITIGSQNGNASGYVNIEILSWGVITETTTTSGSGVYSILQPKNVIKRTTTINSTIDASERNFFLRFDSADASKAFLAKELEVSRLDVSSLTGEYAGFTWDKPPEAKFKAVWQNFISLWVTQYDTAIANQRSQLEYVQKSINSLRKKIDTFDTMASNFRSKAYTIYNKIVNKVN